MGYYEKLREMGMKFSEKVPSGPSYIMPDGQFLDITGSMEIIDPSGSIPASHPAIDQWLSEKGLIDPSSEFNRVLCASDNAIRVNDGTNWFHELVVGLPPARPTEAQFASLENWLYSVFSKGGINVGNAALNGQQVKHYDFSEETPESVIKKIKRFYATGMLVDSIAKSV